MHKSYNISTILIEHLLCTRPHTGYRERIQDLKDYSVCVCVHVVVEKRDLHEVYKVLSGNTVF